MARLGLRRAGPLAGAVVPHRFVQQGVVHRSGKNVVRQFDFPDLLIAQIHYINCRHGLHLLARRTTT